jgi:hypothetical protein
MTPMGLTPVQAGSVPTYWGDKLLNKINETV